MSVISVKNLTQRYGNGRIIYENLSFDVPQGRILGLLGKNGTGKTTTINILMGFLRPLSGECKIFDEDITAMRPETRRRISLLLEGHVQYTFMTIEQIEKFYSKFYPSWNKEVYYELMRKLHVSDNQRISTMSCGQRSQVALGLILAQNAELLVLDDFSLGLDPGYRRLFVDYLRDFAKSENKTLFMTSHIIQDMERLVDDCIMLDYGKIIAQLPVKELMDTFHCYTFSVPENITLPQDDKFIHPSVSKGRMELFSFEPEETARQKLISAGYPLSDFKEHKMTLEDAFIGLTGKY